MYDEVTGDPYCLEIVNAASVTTAGECVVTEATPPPSGGGGESSPPNEGGVPEGGGGESGSSDVTAPVITLTGDSIVNLTVGESYSESGATATDDVDGEIAVVVSGSVDTNAAGSYEIKYNASDAAGNAAVEVIRTVNVSGGEAPPEPPAEETPPPEETP